MIKFSNKRDVPATKQIRHLQNTTRTSTDIEMFLEAFIQFEVLEIQTYLSFGHFNGTSAQTGGYCVFVYINYRLPNKKRLESYFDRWPDAGLTLDKDYIRIYASYIEQRMYLCPTKWSIAATYILKALNPHQQYQAEIIERLRSAVFPSTNPQMLSCLMGTDLYVDINTLCDVLVDRETKVKAGGGESVLPEDIIGDTAYA